MVKKICLQCGRPRFDHWIRKTHWRREWQPTPVFLPGEFHGQRSLAGYKSMGSQGVRLNQHFHFLLFSSCCLHPQSNSSIGIQHFLKLLLGVYTQLLSHVRLIANRWTVAHQAPLSMGFSRQEYQRRLPFNSPGDLPEPEIKPMSLQSSALVGGFFTTQHDLGSPNHFCYLLIN